MVTTVGHSFVKAVRLFPARVIFFEECGLEDPLTALSAIAVRNFNISLEEVRNDEKIEDDEEERKQLERELEALKLEEDEEVDLNETQLSLGSMKSHMSAIKKAIDEKKPWIAAPKFEQLILIGDPEQVDARVCISWRI